MTDRSAPKKIVPMVVTRGERLVLERWRARKAEGGTPPDGREAEELRLALQIITALGGGGR